MIDRRIDQIVSMWGLQLDTIGRLAGWKIVGLPEVNPVHQHTFATLSLALAGGGRNHGMLQSLLHICRRSRKARAWKLVLPLFRSMLLQVCECLPRLDRPRRVVFIRQWKAKLIAVHRHGSKADVTVLEKNIVCNLVSRKRFHSSYLVGQWLWLQETHGTGTTTWDPAGDSRGLGVGGNEMVDAMTDRWSNVCGNNHWGFSSLVLSLFWCYQPETWRAFYHSPSSSLSSSCQKSALWGGWGRGCHGHAARWGGAVTYNEKVIWQVRHFRARNLSTWL